MTYRCRQYACICICAPARDSTGRGQGHDGAAPCSVVETCGCFMCCVFITSCCEVVDNMLCQFADNDLICTTPRLCQKNMTPVALRGRGTTSTYNCFQLQVCTSNLKFLLVSEEARPRPHVCSTGALCLATLTPGGGGGGGSSDKHGYMAFLILAKWEWQVEDLCRPDNAPC